MDVVHPSSDMRTGSPVAPVTPGGKGLLSHKQTVIESTPGVPSEDHGSTTPFLPDANDKVEKRPLGGAVPSPFGGGGGEDHSEIEKKDDAEPAVVETSSINNEKTDSKPETGEDDQQSIDPTEIPTEMSLEEKKLQEVESAEVAEEALEDDIMAKVESGDTEHLRDGPKEQSDSKDEQAAAIFDTKEYHKPLAHPKKQKSGWGKVLIIVLIIIIFAAAGGAAYFLLG
jgi:hypothetical protein